MTLSTEIKKALETQFPQGTFKVSLKRCYETITYTGEIAKDDLKAVVKGFYPDYIEYVRMYENGQEIGDKIIQYYGEHSGFKVICKCISITGAPEFKVIYDGTECRNPSYENPCLVVKIYYDALETYENTLFIPVRKPYITTESQDIVELVTESQDVIEVTATPDEDINTDVLNDNQTPQTLRTPDNIIKVDFTTRKRV